MDKHHTHRHKPPVPAHIRAHLQAQATSGKSIKDYSIDEGLSPLTFYDWRKRYGSRLGTTIATPSAEACKAPLSFTTVGTVRLGESREPLFDIHLADGTRMSVYSGATAGELAPFLKLLSVGAKIC
jgi:hypothetical protein